MPSVESGCGIDGGQVVVGVAAGGGAPACHVVSTFFVACYAGLIIPVVGVGVLSEFTGTFPAVLAFSLLLAALGLFSVARIATALAPDRAVNR